MTGTGEEGTEADPIAAIRRRLDAARRRRGWTFRDMARETGFPRSTLQYMLQRRQRVPDYFELQALVGKLGERWDDEWERLWKQAVETQQAGGDATPDAPRPVAVRPEERPVPRQLPAEMTSFIGRTAELADLDACLLHTSATDPDSGGPEAPARVAAIVGGGGVGKTTLALHWASAHADRFPDGQLHVDLRGFDPTEPAVAPAAVLTTILNALGAEPPAGAATLDALVSQYRTVVAEKKLLVVLDNARDSTQVAPLVAAGKGSATIVTSRSYLADLAVRGARIIPLDVLGEADARRMLLSAVDAARAQDTHAAARGRDAEDAVKALLTWCGGLPLALRIVAARAASQPHLPLGVLVNELRDEGERLDALDAGELRANLRATFSCSYRALPAEAATVFRLFGLAPGPDLSLAAVASLCGTSVVDIKSPLRTLIAGHLVAQHSPGRYRMHDLVRLYARAQADREAEKPEAAPPASQEARHRLADFYLQHAHTANRHLCPHRRSIAIVPPLGPVATTPITSFAEALDWCEAERGNLVALISELHGYELPEHAWRLAYCLWSFYNLRGYWDESLITGEAALAAAEKVGNEWAQAAVLTILGNVCRERRDLEQALGHHLRALDIRRRTGDRQGEGITLGNLGNVYKDLGRFVEALDCYRRDLDICEPDDPWSASITLGNLGLVYTELGRLDDALACHQTGLDISRRIGNRHGEGVALSNLGQVLHRLDRLDDACQRLESAVPILHEVGDRCAAAETYSELGSVCHDRAEPARAEQYWQNALMIFDESNDPRAAEVRAHVARLRIGKRGRRRGPGRDNPATRPARP